MVCEILAARLFNCKPLELIALHSQALDERRLDAMRRGIKRVADGEPVQYVVGQTGFMGFMLKTDRRALIPRQDTEVLVETVLNCAPLWQVPAGTGGGKHPLVVDIGTGSGCIIISLAKAHTDGGFLGLDVSEDALALARENAAALDVADRVIFACAELCDVVEPGMVDAVVSNPPYIATRDYEKLPRMIRDFEPRQALDGGAEGLDILDAVVQDASMALKPDGWLFLEIGWDQGPRVKDLMEAAGFSGVAITRDLGKRDRVVSGRLAV
jgi:release factor glutamine methyltransferase